MDSVAVRNDLPNTDSQFVEVDGLTVHYKRAGRRPAVLLHASGSSLHCFDLPRATPHTTDRRSRTQQPMTLDGAE